MNPRELKYFMSRAQVAEGGCWHWRGGPSSKGYGKITFARREHYAHRVAYTHFVGPIPDGLVIDHLCRNKMCVNPAHLEAVTNRENLRRGNPAGQKRKTHCIRGHAFTPENTRLSQTRRWVQQNCLACARIRDRQKREARRNGHDESGTGLAHPFTPDERREARSA